MIKNIIVENGTQTLILEDIRMNDLKDTYIYVKSGATLNLKLKGYNFLSGNASGKPIICVEENATLNVINGESKDSRVYSSLSLLNSNGFGIAGKDDASYGTTSVNDSVLYVRGTDASVSESADLKTNLNVEDNGYVDANLNQGKLTMNGGTWTGQCGTDEILYGGNGGNILLTGSGNPVVKTEDGTRLHKVQVKLYDTASRFSTAEREAVVQVGDVTGKRRRFLTISGLECLYRNQTIKASAGIPVEVPEESEEASDKERSSSVTLYLAEGVQVMEATVGGAKYYSSANEDLKIISKSDDSASGVLFQTGHLLMKGTMAFRQFTYVNMETNVKTIGRQVCPDYAGSGTYWIDYDEDLGITLRSPGGRLVVGYNLLIQNGEHEVKIDGLKIEPKEPTINSFAVIKADEPYLMSGFGNLTLKLSKHPANGAANELGSQSESGVFDLRGGLKITSDESGAKVTLKGKRAFGNTDAQTSTLEIADSIVANQCEDKTTPVNLEKLKISNSTVTGLGVINCADIVVDGGSADFQVPEGVEVKNSAGQVLTRQELTCEEIHAETKITGITITGLNGTDFEDENLYTDQDGKLYLWLPEGAKVTSLTIGEGENQKTYYAVAFDFGIPGTTITKMVEAGQKVTAPSAEQIPEKEGYEVTGWLKDQQLWNTAEEVVTESMTLEAQWTLRTYEIRYEAGANGKVIDPTAEKTATKTYGQPLDLADQMFERPGYTQIGWSKTEEGQQQYALGGSYTENEEATLYPVWQEKADFALSYDTAGGNEIASRTGVRWTEQVLDGITDPVREGYAFTGWEWNGRPVGTSTTYADLAGTDDTIKEMTLTAQWRDIAAPVGTISMGEDSWTTFHDDVKFDLYYASAKTVEIQATDNSGGSVTTEYLISHKAYTEAELDEETFEAYTGAFELTEDGTYVLYVKLTDETGNTVYLSTCGFVVDTTAPVLSGIEDGKTYCQAQTLSVTEANLAEVLINQVPVTLDENNQYVLSPAKESLKIKVRDLAGNVTEMEVTVNDGHTMEWQDGEGQYWQKCKYCEEATDKQQIPSLVLEGEDQICRTKDYTATFKTVEGCSDYEAYYEAGETKGRATLRLENGTGVLEIPSASHGGKGEALKVILSAKTQDGYRFEVVKTVKFKEHSGNNQKYWYCEDCQKYFKDPEGTIEITKEEAFRGRAKEKEKQRAVATGDTKQENIIWWMLIMMSAGISILKLFKGFGVRKDRK